MRVTPAPVWNYLFPDSPLSSPYPFGIYSIPRKSQLIPEAGCGQSPRKGIADAVICAAKNFKIQV